MIRELAEYERLSHEVVGGPEGLEEHLFGARPAAEAVIAEAGGEPIGFALFFTTFSTFLCRPGLWLEDLFVRPEHRGNGASLGPARARRRVVRRNGSARRSWTGDRPCRSMQEV